MAKPEARIANAMIPELSVSEPVIGSDVISGILDAGSVTGAIVGTICSWGASVVVGAGSVVTTGASVVVVTGASVVVVGAKVVVGAVDHVTVVDTVFTTPFTVAVAV